MKHIKSKVAAIACAAITTICSAQAITASAASQHTTQRQRTCQTAPTNMSDFIRHQAMALPGGSYWNAGVPNRSTGSSVSRVSTYITVGPVCGAGFKNNLHGGPQQGEEIWRSAAFARYFASQYFGTEIFMRHSTDKNFTTQLGDQITYYTSGNATHTVFVTKSNLCCDVTDDFACKITYGKSFSINNGGIIIGGKRYSIKYVERPIKVGDFNGDSIIDSKDPTEINKIMYGGYDWYDNNWNFMRSACDMNRDNNITSADLTKFNSDKNYTEKVMNTYGYVKTLW